MKNDVPNKFSCEAEEHSTEVEEHGLKRKRDGMAGNSVNKGFDWGKYLEDSDLEAADSSAFSHVQRDAVLYTAGCVVEVVSDRGDTAWPARVTMACDSLLRLRYAGSQGSAHDLWCDPAGGRLRPLGWSRQHDVTLAAPPGLLLPADLADEALAEVLPPGDGGQNQAAATPTPRTGGADVERISDGMKLEVLDEANPYHVWTATVLERCGVRLRLRRDTLDDTPDLWLCASSPRVRHFGWAARVGAPFLYSPPTECAADRTQAEWEAILEMSRDEARQMAVDDSVLPHLKYEFPMKHSLSVGCRLEAVHPDRSAICPASIVSVLDSYFFRVQIDDSTISWLSSLEDPTILPYGWCRQHGLDCSGDDLLPSRLPSPGEAEPDSSPDGSLATAPLKREQESPPLEELPDSQRTEGLADGRKAAEWPASPETEASQRTAAFSDSQQTAETSASWETGALPECQPEPMDTFPGSPEMDQLSDSQPTGIKPDSPDTGELPDSQQTMDITDSQRTEDIPDSQETVDIPDSQRTEDIPDSQQTAVTAADSQQQTDSQLTGALSDSVVGDWLLDGQEDAGALPSGPAADDEALGAGEPWMHLSPVSGDLLSSQPLPGEGSPGDLQLSSQPLPGEGSPGDLLSSQPLPGEGSPGDLQLSSQPLTNDVCLPSDVGEDSFCSRDGDLLTSPAPSVGGAEDSFCSEGVAEDSCSRDGGVQTSRPPSAGEGEDSFCSAGVSEDSFCSRDGDVLMTSPPPSAGFQLLDDRIIPSPPAGVTSSPSSPVQPTKELSSPKSEVKQRDGEMPSPSAPEVKPTDGEMPSPSALEVKPTDGEMLSPSVPGEQSTNEEIPSAAEVQLKNENPFSPDNAQTEIQTPEGNVSASSAEAQPSSGEMQQSIGTVPPPSSVVQRPHSAGTLPPDESVPSPAEAQRSKDAPSSPAAAQPSISADIQPPEEDIHPPSVDTQPPEKDIHPPSADRQSPEEDIRLPSANTQPPEEDICLPSAVTQPTVCETCPRQPTEPGPAPVAAASEDGAPPTEPPLSSGDRLPAAELLPSLGDRLPAAEPRTCGGEPISSVAPPDTCDVDCSAAAAAASPVTLPAGLAASPAGPAASPAGPAASPADPAASPADPAASPASPAGPAVAAAVESEPEEEEDAAPRLHPSDLVPQQSAESAGLAAGSALELVHPEAPERLCAAAVQRTAGHLLWLQLLSAAGAPELIFPHTSDSLFPAGWAAANGAALQAPRDWRRRRRTSGRPPRLTSAAPGGALDSELDSESGSSEAAAAASDRAVSDSAASTWAGPLYVNTACHSGPLLSTNKLVAQPRVVGAGPVRLVARDLLTRLVWAGYNESRVLKYLQSSGPARPGWTNDLIKAKVNNTIYGGVVELPLSRLHMAEFRAGVFARLQCCPALVAPTSYLADTCPHRCRTTLRPAQQANRSVELPSAESGPALLRERLGPAKRPRPEYLHAQEPLTRRRARLPKWLEESEAAEAREPPPDVGRPALYQVTLEKNPRLWDADDLARYLGNTECAHLVPALITQELDGVSFMLLTFSTLTDVLHLSERDAVALCTHVSRVKYTYFTAFSG